MGKCNVRMYNNVPQDTLSMHYITLDFIQGIQKYDPALFPYIAIMYPL